MRIRVTIEFANPTLYMNPGVFNDIPGGSNMECGTKGFSANEGWDTVTGLGTPYYDRMLKLFMRIK